MSASSLLSPATEAGLPGVYAGLADLGCLQFQAHGFSLRPPQPATSLLASRHLSRLRDRGANFEDLHRYQFGDDLRLIDWKVSARMHATFSRVFTEERERSVLLLVDQRRSMFFGSVRAMKSVTAAEAAALVAWHVVEQKDRVGALVFNDARVEVIRPHHSHATVMRILHAILEQNHALSTAAGPPANPAMLNTALRQCAELITHDHLIVLISDGYGHDEESRRLFTEIARHNDVLMVFVFDPLEAELPAAGPLVFSDGRRQIRIDTADATRREDFRHGFAAAREAGRKFLLQRETPILSLSTAEPVPDQVRRQLGSPAP